MGAVETLKQSNLTTVVNVLEKVQVQSDAFKTWGVTAGGALVGAATMAASAQGLLALVALLAMPPLAVTVGALGGGVLGWHYMRQRGETRASVRSTTPTSPSGMDDLELINGITPTYAGRLQAAGICTFAQLAAVTPERVHLVIGPTYDSHIIQSERWIADARQLAQGTKPQR